MNNKLDYKTAKYFLKMLPIPKPGNMCELLHKIINRAEKLEAVAKAAKALRGDLLADDECHLPDHFCSWNRLGDTLKDLEKG